MPPPLPLPPAARFFEDYKKNEHKEVVVDDILGAEEAKKVVKDSLNLYQEHYVPKKLRNYYD
jgi:inorganic pyrophosphatase